MNREDRARMWDRIKALVQEELQNERLNNMRRRTKKEIEKGGNENNHFLFQIEEEIINSNKTRNRLWEELMADFVDMDRYAEQYEGGPYDMPWVSFLAQRREEKNHEHNN